MKKENALAGAGRGEGFAAGAFRGARVCAQAPNHQPQAVTQQSQALENNSNPQTIPIMKNI